MAKKKGGPTVTEQLIEAIRQDGRSLNQLSKVCGVGPDRLSRFVRGERDLTGAAIDKICGVLRLGLTPLGPPEEGPPAGAKAPKKAKGKKGEEE